MGTCRSPYSAPHIPLFFIFLGVSTTRNNFSLPQFLSCWHASFKQNEEEVEEAAMKKKVRMSTSFLAE